MIDSTMSLVPLPTNGEPIGDRLQVGQSECGRRYEAAVLSIVSEGIEGGSFAPDLDGQTVTYMVLGAVNWMHRWYAPGGERSSQNIGRQFSRMILGGLVS